MTRWRKSTESGAGIRDNFLFRRVLLRLPDCGLLKQ